MVHNYTYDTRNRLTNLGVTGTVSGAPGSIASYGYTLDAAGHRTGVTELSGRTVGYTYDNLYRLTSETIASDPNAINGAVSYTYDPVGNRKQMTSSLAPIPAGLFNYDANDRFTAGDTYDNNGNTISSGGIGNVYDFENHLIQKGGATMLYDGDGNRNRVFKTVAGVTTGYMVDDRNPTGYVQVMDEVQGPFITRVQVGTPCLHLAPQSHRAHPNSGVDQLKTTVADPLKLLRISPVQFRALQIWVADILRPPEVVRCGVRSQPIGLGHRVMTSRQCRLRT